MDPSDDRSGTSTSTSPTDAPFTDVPTPDVPTPNVPTYVVNQVQVHDMATYQRYVAAAVPAIAEHGGRILASGGRVETMEGEPVPPRVVVIEFPSWEHAEGYYRSAAYQAARELRGDSATVRFALVEGRAREG